MEAISIHKLEIIQFSVVVLHFALRKVIIQVFYMKDQQIPFRYSQSDRQVFNCCLIHGLHFAIRKVIIQLFYMKD